MRTAAVAGLLLAAFAAAAPAQVTIDRFVPVSGSPYTADVYGYVDGLGREYGLLCRGDLGLAIIDVTNPASASVVRNVPATGSDLKDVRIYQSFAYCVQQSGDVLIVDLTDPPTASVVGTIPSSGGHNAFIDEDRGLLYFSRSGGAGSGNSLEIYDLVPNPLAPQLRSSFDPASGHNSHDAYAKGDRCYDFDIFTNITRILDVTNPAAPVELGTLPFGNHSGFGYDPPGGAASMLLTNDEVAGGRVHVFDVTSGQTVPPIATYVTDPAISVHNSFVRGRYAFVAYYLDGLRVLDLANPATPEEVGVFDPHPANTGSIFAGAWGIFAFPESNGSFKVLFNEMFSEPTQGLYIARFTPPERIDLDVSTTGIGDLTLMISGLDPLGFQFLAASAQTAMPFGTGAFLGLGTDAFFNLRFTIEPIRSQADAGGGYVFTVGGGIPPGISSDMRVISFKQSIGTFQLSNITRITF